MEEEEAHSCRPAPFKPASQPASATTCDVGLTAKHCWYCCMLTQPGRLFLPSQWRQNPGPPGLYLTLHLVRLGAG